MTSSPIGPLGQGLVFLLGLPRSGTTLLSVMLGRHPAISAPPEPWLMLALSEIGHVPKNHPVDSRHLSVAVNRFLGEEGRILAARAAATSVYSAHLSRVGRQVFIDKTPRYYFILEFLISVFPEARFIWLCRDPMDVAASYLTTWKIKLPEILKKGYDTPHSFDLTIGLDRLIAFHKRYPGAVEVIHYEELTLNPGARLAAILERIGLSFTAEDLAGMTEFDTRDRDPVDFGDPKIHSTSTPHTNSVGSWRWTFDSSQLEVLLDAIGVDRMRYLGYDATVAELAALGISQTDAEAPERYRAVANRHFIMRQEDVAPEDVVNFAERHPESKRSRIWGLLRKMSWPRG